MSGGTGLGAGQSELGWSSDVSECDEEMAMYKGDAYAEEKAERQAMTRGNDLVYW